MYRKTFQALQKECLVFDYHYDIDDVNVFSLQISYFLFSTLNFFSMDECPNLKIAAYSIKKKGDDDIVLWKDIL